MSVKVTKVERIN